MTSELIREIQKEDTCVLCGTEFERCFGGDRITQEYLYEVKLDPSKECKDPNWKHRFSVCYKCLGKYKKKKQKEFLEYLRDLLNEILEDGSPTWYQCGRVNAIRYLKKIIKEHIKCGNCFDGSSEAEIRGILEVMEKVKERLENAKRVD